MNVVYLRWFHWWSRVWHARKFINPWFSKPWHKEIMINSCNSRGFFLVINVNSCFTLSKSSWKDLKVAERIIESLRTWGFEVGKIGGERVSLELFSTAEMKVDVDTIKAHHNWIGNIKRRTSEVRYIVKGIKVYLKLGNCTCFIRLFRRHVRNPLI